MSDESPGEMIRRGRHEAGLSQAELSERLRVHKGTVGDWERDKYFPERHFGLLNKLLHIRLRKPGTAEQPEPEPELPPSLLADIYATFPDEEGRQRAIRLFRRALAADLPGLPEAVAPAERQDRRAG